MKNIIIIVHNGTELNTIEEAKLAAIVSETTSCDKTTIRISQLTSDEALAAVAGVTYARRPQNSGVCANIDTHSNSEVIEKSIEVIRGIISLGGIFPTPSEFGQQLAIHLVSNIKSKSKAEVAFRNAIANIANPSEDIDVLTNQCRQYNFTKLHIAEVQKAHKIFSSYMLLYVSYSLIC